MVLAFNARVSTKDVDAIFKPKSLIAALASEVSEEEGLPEAWLNDGVKGFQSEKGKYTSKGLPELSHLKLKRPTAQYLLAMKAMAARAPGYDTKGDKGDIKFLLKRLRISTERAALRVVESFYDPKLIVPKTQFMLIECLQELNFPEIK